MGRDIIKCQICMNSIERGKMLACYHAFCHLCIQNEYINHKIQNKIMCPVKACLKYTDLPSMIVADLDDFNERSPFHNKNSEVCGSAVTECDITIKPPAKPVRLSSPNDEITVVEEEQPRERTEAVTTLPDRSIPYKSMLQSEAEIAALKKKRGQLKWQMSVPDGIAPPLTMQHGSDDFKPNRRKRTITEGQLSETSMRNKCESMLSTPKEQNAIRIRYERFCEEHPEQAANLCNRYQVAPKTEMVTTRNSKPKKVSSSPKQRSMLAGGVAALFLSTKVCDSEFRSRAEGPWGICSRDHWAGRSWGEAD